MMATVRVARAERVTDTHRARGLPPIVAATDEEWAHVVDQAARHFLGISGEEFVRRWQAGEFAADADRPEVMSVASLLPEEDWNPVLQSA